MTPPRSSLDEFRRILVDTFHVELPEDIGERLEMFHVELWDWNESAGLVGGGLTLSALLEHSLDSLALLPYLQRDAQHTDIGSGGGFPAVPLALAAAHLQFVCVERYGKKAAFLQRIARVLSLGNLRISQQDFSAIALPEHTTLTARAIEKPELFCRELRESENRDWLFLSQLADTATLFKEAFSVREVDDPLQRFRRGRLYLVHDPARSTWNLPGLG